MSMKWYGVHTYSGFENKVRLNLLENIKNEDVPLGNMLRCVFDFILEFQKIVDNRLDKIQL